MIPIGAPAKWMDEVSEIKELGLDFAEVVISDATMRRLWRESGMRGDDPAFPLTAHGPINENYPCEVNFLCEKYLPTLKATVDVCAQMKIPLLTIHMSVAAQIVGNLVLAEKARALNELVEHGAKRGVEICLENVDESAEQMQYIVKAVPHLGVTLDIGHAELVRRGNALEIIQRVGPAIKHVHIHDNKGGPADLHWPIGRGTIDFEPILSGLLKAGYKGKITMEVKSKGIETSRVMLRKYLDNIDHMA
jgi:sugar phosphate isomerase/epimerase